jgi:hypothetical protein
MTKNRHNQLRELVDSPTKHDQRIILKYLLWMDEYTVGTSHIGNARTLVQRLGSLEVRLAVLARCSATHRSIKGLFFSSVAFYLWATILGRDNRVKKRKKWFFVQRARYDELLKKRVIALRSKYENKLEIIWSQVTYWYCNCVHED